MEKSTKNKSFLVEWLEKLQQESWQLELLISGLALYGVLESRTLLWDLKHYHFEYGWGWSSDIIGMLSTLLNVGWKIFFINLLVHVILRGLWIGAIGLRYVSDDIDFKALNYAPIFETFLRKKIGSYDDFIERLEKICSVLFAFTFLVFLLFLSLILFTLPYSIMFKYFFEKDNILGLALVYGYSFLGFFVFIDFISLGGFKRVKDSHFSTVYYYIYRFFSITTLSFLYRPLLYNFLDNKYTRRLFYLFIPYLLLVITAETTFQNHTHPYFASYGELRPHGHYINDSDYMDLRAKRMNQIDGLELKEFQYLIPHTILSQFYMDESYPSIFFKSYKSDYLLYEKSDEVEPIYEKGMHLHWFSENRYESSKIAAIERERDSLVLLQINTSKLFRDSIRTYKKAKETTKIELFQNTRDSIKQIIEQLKSKSKANEKSYRKQQYKNIIDLMLDQVEVRIDTINYKDSLKCHYYKHPNNNEKGILCHFPSRAIPEGMHNLHIKRNFIYSEGKDISVQDFKLPFIKLKNN